MTKFATKLSQCDKALLKELLDKYRQYFYSYKREVTNYEQATLYNLHTSAGLLEKLHLHRPIILRKLLNCGKLVNHSTILNLASFDLTDDKYKMIFDVMEKEGRINKLIDYYASLKNAGLLSHASFLATPPKRESLDRLSSITKAINVLLAKKHEIDKELFLTLESAISPEGYSRAMIKLCLPKPVFEDIQTIFILEYLKTQKDPQGIADYLIELNEANFFDSNSLIDSLSFQIPLNSYSFYEKICHAINKIKNSPVGLSIETLRILFQANNPAEFVDVIIKLNALSQTTDPNQTPLTGSECQRIISLLLPENRYDSLEGMLILRENHLESEYPYILKNAPLCFAIKQIGTFNREIYEVLRYYSTILDYSPYLTMIKAFDILTKANPALMSADNLRRFIKHFRAFDMIEFKYPHLSIPSPLTQSSFDDMIALCEVFFNKLHLPGFGSLDAAYIGAQETLRGLLFPDRVSSSLKRPASTQPLPQKKMKQSDDELKFFSNPSIPGSLPSNSSSPSPLIANSFLTNMNMPSSHNVLPASISLLSNLSESYPTLAHVYKDIAKTLTDTDLRDLTSKFPDLETARKDALFDMKNKSKFATFSSLFQKMYRISAFETILTRLQNEAQNIVNNEIAIARPLNQATRMEK